jgi:cation:H+ antiporter
MAVDRVVVYALVGAVSIFSLILTARLVVRRLEAVAKFYELSEVVIGMTVVSIGTSLPEIAAHLVASYRIVAGLGDPRILSATVLGGNIGSDVVQQTLVLGLVVVIVGGFQFSKKFLVRDYGPMIGTTLVTLLLSWDRSISRLDGAILLTLFSAYMYFLYTTRKEVLQEQGTNPPSNDPRRDTVVALVALVFLVASAHLLLQVAEFFVERTALEGSLIGVLVLGIGAASPEMTTAITGLREGAEGISLGTLIGSNITNPLFGIGIGALISTYRVPKPLVYWDLPMETVTAAVLLTYLLTKDDAGRFIADRAGAVGLDGVAARFESVQERHLGRVGACLLILMYFVYLVVRISYFPHDF